MEHTKKMLLVEPEFIDKLKQNDNKVENVLSRLDSEMHKILKSEMDDREKWTLYMQTLQRYLHFTKQDRKSFKLPIIVENNSLTESVISSLKNDNKDAEPTFVETSTKQVDAQNNISQPITQYTVEYISKLIPKTFKKKAEILMETLNNHKDKIHWNDNGTVVINGELIPSTNIADLISDTLRPLKRPKPRGWEKFAVALKDTNVPLYCVGNPKTREYVNELYMTEFKNTNSEEKHTPNTPISTKLVKSAKKIDWERWTPY